MEERTQWCGVCVRLLTQLRLVECYCGGRRSTARNALGGGTGDVGVRVGGAGGGALGPTVIIVPVLLLLLLLLLLQLVACQPLSVRCRATALRAATLDGDARREGFRGLFGRSNHCRHRRGSFGRNLGRERFGSRRLRVRRGRECGCGWRRRGGGHCFRHRRNLGRGCFGSGRLRAWRA